MKLDQAVYLLLDNVQREITEEELDPKSKSYGIVRDRIEHEPSFRECGNLPGKILNMAKKLQKKSSENKGEEGKLFSDLRLETLERIKRLEVETLERIKRLEEKKRAAKSQAEKKELT